MKQSNQEELRNNAASTSAELFLTVEFDSDSDCASNATTESSNAEETSATSQNRTALRNLSLLCERFNVSNRVGAALGTGALKDHGLVTDTDTKFVIDRSKLRRERNKYRREIQAEEEKLFGLVDSIYVDGRKDATQSRLLSTTRCTQQLN